ncbi:hypothetical protein RM190_08660 [Paracoccus sp. CPCC 101403]|uniref:Uncharacterized protein n=2 Tax=Paracoccus broussonetiae TaxID=3075834 RepID=A0ABU3ECG8_9RHOB|nr:hypothetical protein [Paracoccus sp. CPCC 101403]
MPPKRFSSNPFRNPMLYQQAEKGMLLTVRCTMCKRTARYWATDLMKVVGPYHQAHLPPFKCGQCKTSEYLDIQWSLPSAGELAEGLTVRRPVRQITKWIWQNEKT